KTRPYGQNKNYEDLSPAYRYGWESGQTYGREGSWEDHENALERGWDKAKGKTQLAWNEAKDAVHDAWNRATDRTYPAGTGHNTTVPTATDMIGGATEGAHEVVDPERNKKTKL